MIKDLTTINNMISSDDKENVYLAACILRKDTINFTVHKRKTLLNKISLFDKIKSYSDVCEELNEKELTILDFNFLSEEYRIKALNQVKIQQIQKLFNQNWIKDWTNVTQKKWYPYFEYKAGSGLVFYCSFSHCYDSYGSSGQVAYYQDEKTSDFCSKLFIDIYKEII